MSNLLQNGNFSTPAITTNSSLQYDSFTTLQKTNFIWLGADYSNSQNITLINGSNTQFVYQNPSVIGVNQYLQLRFNASISQTINITEAGRYLLSFYYCKRVPNTSNQPTYIYFDNLLIATLQSTIPETWTLYSIDVNVKTRGNKLLKLHQPVNISTYNIAFTKFSLVSFETFPDCGTVYLPPKTLFSIQAQTCPNFGQLYLLELLCGITASNCYYFHGIILT